MQGGAATRARAGRRPTRAAHRVHREVGPPEGRRRSPRRRAAHMRERRPGCHARKRRPGFGARDARDGAVPQGARRGLGRVLGAGVAQDHRGGGYTGDAVAVRTLRVEPALRPAVRHPSRGARDGRPTRYRQRARRVSVRAVRGWRVEARDGQGDGRVQGFGGELKGG